MPDDEARKHYRRATGRRRARRRPGRGAAPGRFDFGIVLVGLIAHFALSILYALVIAFMVRSVRAPVALLIGAGAGLVLYLINFYGFTAVFPWFANARNWVTIFAHLVFGIVAAAWYRSSRAVRRP